jgi:peptidoglycan/xylan/chitin deacetylase (PgdA/CDA1 family)
MAFVGAPNNAQAAAVIPNNNSSSTSCNCVVFRLDDIQDHWFHNVQLAVLDKFIDTNTKVTLGLIMNYYGADPVTVNKVSQGKNAHLFELALHGWNHVDYATLSLSDQESTLREANAKLQTIHSTKSNIFITPYNSMNQNTLTAMKEIRLKIVSADLNADGSPPFLPPTFSSSNSSDATTRIIKSLPMTVNFVDPARAVGSDGQPVSQLTSAINESIAKRGWAVVMLHPRDFAAYDGNSHLAQNAVNATQMTTLQNLIAQLKSDGKTITSFNGLVAMIRKQLPPPDTIKPTGTITSPAAGGEVQINTPITVTGIASDDTRVASVEVRAVNAAGTQGTAYTQATTFDGFAHWSLMLTLPDASYNKIIARVTDSSGNHEWFQVAVTTMN